MEEKAKVLELGAAVAWKVVSESAGKLSERQEYLKVLRLVAKVLDPSKRAVWAWWKRYVIAVTFALSTPISTRPHLRSAEG
jgi:hypothetical protein